MDTLMRQGFPGVARVSAVVGVGLIMSACGGDGSPTDPNSNGNGADVGSIQITTVTTNNLDPNGFEVTVDGGSAVTVGVNGSVTIPDVTPGDRTVILAGVAPNCALEGEGTRTASVSKGNTATVSYSVTCTDPPDGRIFFMRSGRGASFFSVMNSDGSGMTDLFQGGSTSTRFAFSPEGEQVAFTLWTGGRLQLFVMNKDASEITQLTSNADWYEGRPSWSPDGGKIAFQAGPENFQIMVMDADGSNPTRLTDHPDHWSESPDWSPDGSQIAFSRRTIMYSYASEDLIYVMNADGTGLTALSQPAPICDQEYGLGWPMWHDHFPQWSPDGSQILFLRSAQCGADPANNYDGHIMIMNADGTNVTELAADDAWPADWSPDGSRIVFIKDGIYTMNADGSGRTLIRESHGWEQFEDYHSIGWGG